MEDGRDGVGWVWRDGVGWGERRGGRDGVGETGWERRGKGRCSGKTGDAEIDGRGMKMG